MAENVNITPGSGDVVGADDISSVKYQRVKLIEGADGVNDGDISSANPLPVEIRDSAGATAAADLSAIKTALEILDNIVSGTEAQVDVVASLPAGDHNIGNVDIASALPAGTNAIGKLAANSGVDIGDVDIKSQPARDNATDTITASLDTNAIMNDTTALTPKYAAINATVNGDNTLVAAVVGKKIRVLSYVLVADAAVGCAFEDGAGGSELSGQMAFAANGGVSVPFSPVGHFETTANTLLNLETDAVANVRGHIAYVEV